MKETRGRWPCCGALPESGDFDSGDGGWRTGPGDGWDLVTGINVGPNRATNRGPIPGTVPETVPETVVKNEIPYGFPYGFPDHLVVRSTDWRLIQHVVLQHRPGGA